MNIIGRYNQYTSVSTYQGKFDISNRTIYPGDFILTDADVPNIPTQNIDNLKEGMSVYIYKTCDIPRTQVSQTFKRVLKLSKADIVVIPHKAIDPYTSYYFGYYYTDGTILVRAYVNGSDKSIIDASAKTLNFTCLHSAENTKLYTAPQIQHCLDYDAGDFGNKIVLTDAQLMSFITSNPESMPTVDDLVSILDMMKSSDRDTRVLGCKMLAVMDYANYPASISHVFTQLRPAKADETNGTSVKFMKEVLVRSGYYYNRATTVSQEDFDLLVSLLRRTDSITLLCNKSFISLSEDLRIVPNIKCSDT